MKNYVSNLQNDGIMVILDVESQFLHKYLQILLSCKFDT